MLLAILLACTDGSPPPSPPAPAEDALLFPALSAGEPLTLVEGGAPTRTPVTLPEAVVLWDAHGDRAVLLRNSDREKALLLNLETGALIDGIGTPRAADWDAGRLSTAPTALTALRDGTTTTPQVTTPSGPADSSWLLVSEGQVFVLAKDTEGGVWFGPWADTDDADVSISSRLPQMPRDMGLDHRGRPEAWVSRGVPGDGAEGTCVRWRLDGPEPVCVAIDDPTPTAQRLALSGGWSAADAWGEPVTLYRDSQPTPWRLEPACDWTLTAALSDPPRVLAECQPSRDAPTRERRLWSPEGERAWQRTFPPAQRGMFRTRTVDAPVIAETIPGSSPALATRWIDLEGLAGWSSPPLVPLRGDSHPHAALARDPQTGDVVLVDVGSGTLHRLMDAGEDCPVDLIEQVRAGQWVLLSCRQQRRSDAYEYQQMFAQLIDLEGRRTWRIEAMVEALLDDGRLLVSDRTIDQAEGAVAFGALEVWDLSGAPSP